MKNDEPEKLIVSIPRRLWKLMKLPSIAFCLFPRDMKHVVATAFLLVMGSVLLRVLFTFDTPLLGKFIGVIASAVAILSPVLLLWPVVFIREDCFTCKLGFYVIAHERNHLLLRESDEFVVEKETLKHNADKLVPLLLEDEELCEDCVLRWRKMYFQATRDYMKKHSSVHANE